jgi:argininosuccinate lyase
MDLRSKRLSTTLDPAAAALLSSLDEDADIAALDILGTAAHAQALGDAHVLTAEEADALTAALTEAHALALTGDFPLDAAHEDVHMAVEAWLTQRLGDLGRKVHTGRSRNDQVALDLRMAARTQVLAEADALFALIEALQTLAAKAPEATMPGYTHAQPAQPVAFAHWCGMHIERFVRDLARLRDAYARVNVSPLGAAALAGTGFAVDPVATANRLGFDQAARNSMDAVSDRDFLVELAAAQAQTAVHVSQLAQDVIQWVAPAHGFLRLDDAHATGSSIMPQKRNPDVFEVARSAAGTAIGELVASLTILKAQPSTYNRDLQEQKRVALGSWARWRALMATLPGAVAGLEPVPGKMQAAAGQGFTDATEVADHLVRQGVPFRTAHDQAAALVTAAAAAGTNLAGLDDAAIASVLGEHAAGVRGVLGPTAARAAKTSHGGTAPEAVAAQQDGQAAEIEELGAFFTSESNRLALVVKSLLPEHPDMKVNAQ